MKTLIVYYSQGGNTEYAAEKIAAELGAETLRIRPSRAYPDKGFRKFFWGGKSAMMAEKPALMPYDFRGEDYEQIVFGFPVWAGSVTPPIRSFVQENFAALRDKRIAAFACQSGAGGEKALRRLKECLEITDFRAELILIDPKDKPSDANERRIQVFCDRCR